MSQLSKEVKETACSKLVWEYNESAEQGSEGETAAFSWTPTHQMSLLNMLVGVNTEFTILQYPHGKQLILGPRQLPCK